MRIAAIQMVSGKDIQQNLAAAERLLVQAHSQGAEVAVLPENFACYGRGKLRAEGELESRGEGPIILFLRETARRLGLWLLGGTIPLTEDPVRERQTAQPQAPRMADGERVFAASCLIDANGEMVGRYDKVHLFDVEVGDGIGAYRESDYLCPGLAPQVVESPWGKLGLSVCYDLRFPEHYQTLVEEGAEILLVPSAFTYTTGAAHWEILLRARAIETQCFVVAANQGGWHDEKRRSYGHSMIVHPWGQVLAQQTEGEGVVIAELDLDQIAECRRRMPLQSHRALQAVPVIK